MNDDNFKKGFILGMAMNPLYVVAEQGSGNSVSENFCVLYVVPNGIICDDAICEFIK